MISMLFKWLKKKDALKNAAPESHFPIKVLIDPEMKHELPQAPPSATLAPDSNLAMSTSESDDGDFSEKHALYSRCGFNTCNELQFHESDGKSKSDQQEARDSERLRNEILNSDNLEECLKMIEKQSAMRPDRTSLRSSEPFVEPKMAETCDKYTIWGNKISE